MAEAEAQPEQQQQPEQTDTSKKRKVEDGETADCKFYLKGACKFGERCRNKHDKKQRVNGDSPAIKILEPAIPGVDQGREPCKWLKRGVCKFGARCRNAHPPGLVGRPVASSAFNFSPFPISAGGPFHGMAGGRGRPPPPRTRESPRNDKGSSGTLCKFFARGDCKFGEACRSIHSTEGVGSLSVPVTFQSFVEM
jgi:hypothetical protein